MIIIGITGTIGAGKGTVVEYLVQQHHFAHFSVRKFLTAIIEQQNIPLNRDSMVAVANELRANNSPSYIVEQLYSLAIKSHKNCIIESIRTPGEIEALRKLGDFYLLAVDANPKIRYDRIIIRNSETDKISFDTFLENEKREMTSTDPNKQNLSVCMENADFRVENNGSFEELNKQVAIILNKINK